jgi:hypothetical protein
MKYNGGNIMICNNCQKEIPEDAKLCPYCGQCFVKNLSGSDPVKDKKKKKIPLGCLVTIILTVLCISLPVAYGGFNSTKPSRKTAVRPTYDYNFADVMQLIDEYDKNSVAADMKYKNKKVKLTGIVNNIGKDILGNVYVTISNDADAIFEDAQCFFEDDSQVNKVTKLKVGDTITVIGSVGEYLVSLSIDKCEIISNPS